MLLIDYKMLFFTISNLARKQRFCVLSEEIMLKLLYGYSCMDICY